MKNLIFAQRTDENSYSASWLELFFDLVFVAMVAQLTYHFSYNHSTFEDFLQLGIVGYMIFLSWMLTTANRNLRQEEDLTDIIGVQLQMALILIMSLTLPQAFAEYSWLFFGAMGLNGFIGLAFMRRMYRLNPQRRPQTFNVWWGFFMASCLWFVTGFLEGVYLYIVATLALITHIAAPMTQGKGNVVTMLNMDHLLERLGLFLLLVMGEAVLVVALINSAAGEFSFEQLVIVLSGFILMVALWWWYFPYIHNHAHGKRAPWFQLMLHTHGFLYGSLILIAGGLKILLNDPYLPIFHAWIYLVGVLLMVVTFNIIRATLTHHPLEAVKSIAGFLVGFLVLILLCYWLDLSVYYLVTGISIWLLLYVAIDYRKHFGNSCVIY